MMRVFDQHWLKNSVAIQLKREASRGTLGGQMNQAARLYMAKCSAFHAASGTVVIFTRDTGMHASGWFKNPDYERCLHLSLSFKEPFKPTHEIPFDKEAAKEWVEIFFLDDRRYA